VTAIVTESNLRDVNRARQLLYEHLLDCVRREEPGATIERYRRLFLGVGDYDAPEVRAALEQIVEDPDAQIEFPSAVNRSWYIAINQWQMSPPTRASVPDLVRLFDDVRPPRATQSRLTRRLRQLLLDFKETEQFQTLQRIARLSSDVQEGAVGNLIVRYPYLYEHCLLSQDSSRDHQDLIRALQRQTQKRFELNLSQYVVQQVRLSQRLQAIADADAGLVLPQKADGVVVPDNPTLLSDRALRRALRHFVGNVGGERTYRDLALSFIAHSAEAPTYREFKRDLYEYLVSSVNHSYGQRMFNTRLADHLAATLPQCDAQRPNEFLVLRTSSQLLRFLVIDSRSNPDHFIFLDLVGNLGTTPTVGLLLKVTLMCTKVRPYLDKRFALLFAHYETSPQEGVPWLVRSLENMHIALTVHFGSVDLSSWKQVS